MPIFSPETAHLPMFHDAMDLKCYMCLVLYIEHYLQHVSPLVLKLSTRGVHLVLRLKMHVSAF
jgi:hypothetical protein